MVPVRAGPAPAPGGGVVSHPLTAVMVSAPPVLPGLVLRPQKLQVPALLSLPRPSPESPVV